MEKCYSDNNCTRYVCVQGPQGDVGLMGPVGQTGPTGLQGPVGQDGHTGPTGNDGTRILCGCICNGIISEGCPMGVTGEAGTLCLDRDNCCLFVYNGSMWILVENFSQI